MAQELDLHPYYPWERLVIAQSSHSQDPAEPGLYTNKGLANKGLCICGIKGKDPVEGSSRGAGL